MQEEDDEEEDDEDHSSNTAEEEVLVRRTGDDSWSIISYQLSRHNGRWLIDSIVITE